MPRITAAATVNAKTRRKAARLEVRDLKLMRARFPQGKPRKERRTKRPLPVGKRLPFPDRSPASAGKNTEEQNGKKKETA